MYQFVENRCHTHQFIGSSNSSLDSSSKTNRPMYLIRACVTKSSIPSFGMHFPRKLKHSSKIRLKVILREDKCFGFIMSSTSCSLGRRSEFKSEFIRINASCGEEPVGLQKLLPPNE
mmetsp:Transcript_34303/g.39059  ORF Transcript_34303/g.39059 Transcript_34303/m.39059 type:complete len:117 (-) Transcript_34303:1019-1369(-)